MAQIAAVRTRLVAEVSVANSVHVASGGCAFLRGRVVEKTLAKCALWERVSGSQGHVTLDVVGRTINAAALANPAERAWNAAPGHAWLESIRLAGARTKANAPSLTRVMLTVVANETT